MPLPSPRGGSDPPVKQGRWSDQKYGFWSDQLSATAGAAELSPRLITSSRAARRSRLA